MANKDYGEDLPAECPPAGLPEDALTDVFRLIAKSSPDEECFASKRALGIKKPDTYKGNDCEWASCSLFVTVEAMLKIKGLRKRNPYVARLSIPAESGHHRTDEPHVHFWKFAGFEIHTAVQEIWEHGRS